MRRVRALTRELDIPLVVDEVQTGCGRTGTWFAFEQYGIEPDVIVASKALCGIGQPVAIIMYDERLDVWAPGAHTGTFRGNQLAFAAGARGGADRAPRRRAGQRRGAGRADRASGWPSCAATRGCATCAGRGLMWGDRAGRPGHRAPGRRSWPAGCRPARSRHGLIVELGGRDDCVVRMLPPLNVTAEVVDIACDILIEPSRSRARHERHDERRRGRGRCGARPRAAGPTADRHA